MNNNIVIQNAKKQVFDDIDQIYVRKQKKL